MLAHYDETSQLDCIQIRKHIVDLCGGINEALILEHLMSNKPEKVFRDGKKYARIKRTDWYRIARLSPKQYDVAIRKLSSLGFTETRIFKTEDGDLSTHIWVDYDAVERAMSEV